MTHSPCPSRKEVLSRIALTIRLAASLARRDFDSQHRASLLGRLWAGIQPLALILVYTLVFSRVMHSRLPGQTPSDGSDFAYSIYLCAGLLPWTYFSEAVAKGQSALINSAQLLKKLSLSIATAILAANLAALRNFLIISALFFVFLIVSENLHKVHHSLLLLPLVGLQACLALQLGSILAITSVYFRDVGPITTISLQFGFWLTPVVYPVSLLPTGLQAALQWLNPMFPVVGWYQAIALGQPLPSLTSLLPCLVWIAALSLILIGLVRHRSEEIPDLI